MVFKIIVLFVLSFTLFAGVAIEGKRVFTQPDGTQFEGYLKGDSSFHWIESGGSVVIYNPEDKFYYKSLVESESGLILTQEKPNSLTKTRVLQHDTISDEVREKLHQLSQKTKQGNYPR